MAHLVTLDLADLCEDCIKSFEDRQTAAKAALHKMLTIHGPSRMDHAPTGPESYRRRKAQS